MSDSANIHQAGVQINFNTWERFNLEELTNDGVVFFQYLVFHCKNNAWWTHSDNGLLYELGIKRGRIESLRGKFIELGILETNITRDKDNNKIRAYRINFTELTKPATLKSIYREADSYGQAIDFAPYVEVYKGLAATQPKAGKVTAAKAKVEAAKASEVKELAASFENVFRSRRDAYNRDLTREADGESIKLATGYIRFSPKNIQQLAKAIAHFDNDTNYITNAWIVYCDVLNEKAVGRLNDNHDAMLPDVVKSITNYFLTYSNAYTERGYSTIWRFGDYYIANYHTKRW